MKIEYTDHYKRHGCDYRGDIAFIDYYDEMKVSEPALINTLDNWIRFSNDGTNMMNEAHPDCEIVFSIPSVVARITK